MKKRENISYRIKDWAGSPEAPVLLLALWLWGLCLGSLIQTALPSPGVLEPVASPRGSLTANSATFWAVIPAAVRAQSAYIFKDPASHLGQP